MSVHPFTPFASHRFPRPFRVWDGQHMHRWSPDLYAPRLLSQWTGITNHLGQPIYEGDILRGEIATGHTRKARRREWTCVVEWSNWSHGWVMAGPIEGAYRFHPSFESCEVIGNRWEHPDLLARTEGR